MNQIKQIKVQKMERSDGTCEDTEDSTMLVQIEEEKCDIRKMSLVTKLSLVREVKTKEQGYGDSLSVFRNREDSSVTGVQRSKVHQFTSRVSSQRTSKVSHVFVGSVKTTEYSEPS